MTAENIIQNIVQDGAMGEIGRKIIKYQAKEKAIQDCILALRDNSQMSTTDTMNCIRQLSKTQFRNSWKMTRLVRYC